MFLTITLISLITAQRGKRNDFTNKLGVKKIEKLRTPKEKPKSKSQNWGGNLTGEHPRKQNYLLILDEP